MVVTAVDKEKGDKRIHCSSTVSEILISMLATTVTNKGVLLCQQMPPIQQACRMQRKPENDL
eukprot:8233046-Ditylum_brightwellii.AAC.1